MSAKHEGLGVAQPALSGLDGCESVPEGRRRVIGYITVRKGTSRAPQDATRAIRRACERADWCLVEVVVDRDSGRRSLERPGVGYALEKIAAGEAQGLVVSELMRLVRSQVDLGTFMQWFIEHDAALVGLDLDIDTTTADGRRIADVLITLGQWEQRRIAQRTKTGLANAKADGRPVGRPSIGDRPALRRRIVEMREAGMTLQAIADRLNADGVATLRGGARWRPSSVQAALGYRRPSTKGGRVTAGRRIPPTPPAPERTGP
jgi:DNA invertase Pin-like site-specific DNA recombinase